MYPGSVGHPAGGCSGATGDLCFVSPHRRGGAALWRLETVVLRRRLLGRSLTALIRRRCRSGYPARSLSVLCVIDCSSEVDQAESSFRCALFATVGGARPLTTAQQVRQAIASSLNVGLESLEVAVAEPEDFIIFLPDSVTTDRVFNGGSPLHAPGFSVFLRRWTRVAHGQAAVLPSFIQVELRGIPVHVWSKATTQQLLGKPSEARRDLAVFRLSVWCWRPIQELLSWEGVVWK
jgi:hypothetical protein